ncbi:MAG: hypothetical protein HYY24_03035 [Verrucomicrobia bacterium]|nr:hypothetical protein [Verrucomicrobiota bacterium]
MNKSPECGGRGFAAALSLLALGAALCARAAPSAIAQTPFGDGLADYSKTEDTSSVARLQQRLDQGEARLGFNPFYGYLLDVLNELKVSPCSQLLVFSRSSAQREAISTTTTRAVYFNEQTYITWIPGSPTLEISAVDPKLGAVFYTLEQKETRQPRFTRSDRCLECHTAAVTSGVPGFLVRSLVTDEHGVPDLNRGLSLVTHATPLAERWGGWYVCGAPGSLLHRGNLVGATTGERSEPDSEWAGGLTGLGRFFDLCRYPEPTSDIVALLVLEHQVHLQNLLTRLRYEATRELARGDDLSRLKPLTEAVVRYLLFAEEAPLSTPVKGVSDFTRWFESQGPADQQGRSLRQFDLRARLFKYPCSYLIYSEAFDKLPREVKLQIYRRLWLRLTGDDGDPAFRHIPAETKQAIVDILIETKPDVPVYWKL